MTLCCCKSLVLGIPSQAFLCCSDTQCAEWRHSKDRRRLAGYSRQFNFLKVCINFSFMHTWYLNSIRCMMSHRVPQQKRTMRLQRSPLERSSLEQPQTSLAGKAYKVSSWVQVMSCHSLTSRQLWTTGNKSRSLSSLAWRSAPSTSAKLTFRSSTIVSSPDKQRWGCEG